MAERTGGRGGHRGGGGGRGFRRDNPGPMIAYDESNPSFKEHWERAMEMFHRKVPIETSNCIMPELKDFFSGVDWELPDLASSRDKLNETKNSLDTWDRRQWEKAAADANPADQVREKLRRDFRVELGTIAWAKMYETIWGCNMMPRDSAAVPFRERGSPGVVTVHLCEAPGAFIAATNHFVKTHRPDWRWDWMAVSLNPYYEGNDKLAMIEDDALIAATQQKWCFGADNSGDIRRIENIRAIWERAKGLCRQMGCPGGALMVTADGAVDTSMDPNRQELITASLHFCEVVAALGVLAVGGNFVWKGFTLYEHPSICSLYLMGCVFDEVLVYKPATSKPANSEVYVVGRGFRGVPEDVKEMLLQHCGEASFDGRSLFPLEILPDDFLQTARTAAVYFGNTTAEAINDAIRLRDLPQAAAAPLRAAKQRFAEWWCQQLQVMPLDRSQYLAPNQELDGRRNNTSGAKRKGGELTGTLEQRQEQFRKRRMDMGLDAGGGGAGGAVAGGLGMGGDFGGGGGLGLGAGGGGVGAGGGDEDGGGMQMSSKAMAMMAKLGYKEGQGLGRSNQGMAAALEVAGNQQRAGLGLGQGASSAVGAAPDWSLAPDSAVLSCPDAPLTAAEAASWPALESCVAPPPEQINKSKMLPDDAALLALRVARRDCSAAGPGDGRGACRHIGHCLAPRRLRHASRSYWKLAAVDSALEVCAAACRAASRSDSVPHALDLSLLGGAGAAEYLLTTAAAAAARQPQPINSDWRVTMLETTRAREFAVGFPKGDLTAGTDPRVRFEPLPAEDGDELGPQDVCSAANAQAMAEAAPGCWLVLGDLGSLRRVQDPRLGVLEGELTPVYRRSLLFEVAVALSALAPGGCAVFRLGGCLTFFTAGVLYLLHRSFAQVAIVKPFSSCACSSERFVVAMGLLDDVGVARQRALGALALMEQVEMTQGPEDVRPAAVLNELVPAGVLVRSTDFLRYVERRTTALAEREAQHCRAAADAAAAGEPPPTEEEFEQLGQQAESVLEGGAPPAPAAGLGGEDDETRLKFGGMFTRGGLGSEPSGGMGTGAAASDGRPAPNRKSQQYPPPPPPQQQLRQHPPPPGGHAAAAQQRRPNQPGPAVSPHQQHDGAHRPDWNGNGAPPGKGPGGDAGGAPPVAVMFSLLSRSERGDEYVCRVRTEVMADAAARTGLDSAESAVATRYCYREDFEPQQHYRAGLSLLPADSGADAGRLARLMAFLANSSRPDGKEKVALLVPLARGEGDDAWPNRRRVCVSLQERGALDPEQDGLVLWV